MSENPENQPWDVVVLGGALAGASTALLLRRRNPRWRILIVEKSDRLGRRVGESTVETSAYFIGRVLGFTDHLNESHLVKQGMRFWFCNDQTRGLADCSETGPKYNVRFPGYQVDRAGPRREASLGNRRFRGGPSPQAGQGALMSPSPRAGSRRSPG